MSSRSDLRRLALAAAALVVSIAPLAVSVVSAPPAAADVSVAFTGHGWGHGRGMGQFGAQGYAKDFGWSSSEILDHFYGGTTAGSIADGSVLDVRLIAQDNRDLVVTSGVPFNVGGIRVDPWRGIRITHRSDGQWQMFVANACGQPELADYQPIIPNTFIEPDPPVDPGNDINKMITICNEDGAGHNVSYRGMIKPIFDSSVGAGVRTINRVTFEQYLRGVVPRESPASFAAAALQSQAVAARSYAMAENRYSYAKTCDTTACQVYAGAGNSGQYLEDSRTDAAIAATANVVRMGSTGVARTEFSSSTGGYTAGGTFPAVPDDGDATSSNPNHTWNATLTGSQIATAYGVGNYQGVSFTSRNGLGDFGGRVLSMQIIGSSKTVTATGDNFAAMFGLKSNWFNTVAPPPFLTWWLRTANSSGPPDITVVYGAKGDRPIAGDWANTGKDGIGVYSGNTFYLRDTVDAGPPTRSVAFGAAGWMPVAGKWNGTTTGIGVFNSGTWYLRNSVSPGAPDAGAFAYGSAADVPIVGDWDGDGKDTIGVYENGTFYLRNSNSPGAPDKVIPFGAAGWLPLAGRWVGAGQGIGVFDKGWWYLRNSVSAGPPDNGPFAYGTAGYIPVTGNWSGGASDTVGVVVSP
jgi:SpoIID/LytB domain protein